MIDEIRVFEAAEDRAEAAGETDGPLLKNQIVPVPPPAIAGLPAG